MTSDEPVIKLIIIEPVARRILLVVFLKTTATLRLRVTTDLRVLAH